MQYNIHIKRSAEKELDVLPNEIHDRIIDKIVLLKDEPKPHGIKS